MIYLDNAATTFPKPRSVIKEVEKCLTDYCGNPGRGSHKMSLAAAEKIYSCRCRAAAMFGAKAENVIFTMNTTYALNMAIKTLAKPGDHVIISSMEHNSVFRPVYALAQQKKITYSVFDAFSGDPVERIREKLRPETSLVLCAHASNICGKVLPVERIGAFLNKRNIRFIVDAAQSAGHYPTDISRSHIDALCVPGHKGLYGVQGSAMLICGDGFSGTTFMEGGSGINSADPTMPDFLPERYEAGTLPTPCIAGLDEGITFVEKIGIDTIREYEESLFREAYARLCEVPKVKQYSKGSMLLFNIEGKTPSEVCEALDSSGICVRGGLHCSPLAHASLGTGKEGAVRASFGIFNIKDDVLRFCESVRKLAK